VVTTYYIFYIFCPFILKKMAGQKSHSAKLNSNSTHRSSHPFKCCLRYIPAACTPEKLGVNQKGINQRQRQQMCNVTLRHLCITTVAMENEEVLHIPSVCM
jgi:hypothetical protein